jgi:zinc protease
VDGTEESVEGITREDVVGFYDSFYRPNNAVMAVVGDLNRDELRALIDKYFKGWKEGKIPAPPGAGYQDIKGKEVVKVDREITQSNIILGHRGVSRQNPDFYALSVMNYILGGGGFASRLMDNIRDNKGLSYDVHSSFSADRYAGSFRVVLQTKNRSANTAIGEILREMERIEGQPVSDKELADAKAYLTGSFPLRLDSNSKMASYLTAVEYYGLGLDYVSRYPKLINAVTKEDIERVARKYLNTKDFVLVVVGNLKEAALEY